MRFLAIIPARLASTRLPEKLLQEITPGETILERSVKNAEAMLSAGIIDGLLTAVDHPRLAEILSAKPGTANRKIILTSPDCANGSERAVEALRKTEAENPHIPHYDVILNLQADEPLIPHRAIETLREACLKTFVETSKERTTKTTAGTVEKTGTVGETGAIEKTTAQQTPDIVSLMKPIDATRAALPNTVKVVCNHVGNALYFSRACIPHGGQTYYQHIGLYAYRRRFLLDAYPKLTPTPLEASERLEQLRMLEHGFAIRMEVFNPRSDELMLDVNDAADLAALRQALS